MLDNSENGDLYKMVVYDLSGSIVFQTTFSTQYDSIKFDSDSILMSSSNVFSVMNMYGKLLTTQTVELPIDTVLTTGSRGSYVLINSKYIQNIKLK